MTNWQAKLLMPLLYLLGTLTLFYVVSQEYKFVFDAYQILGITVTLLAFVFWFTARFQLAGAFSLSAKASDLVTKGIYSKVRHPVYVFSFLALAGICLFLSEWLLVLPLALLLVLQVFRIRQEEKILEAEFGEAYRVYKKQTWL